jgi:hypothetical protein
MTKKTLIGINGKIGAGKDTVGEIIQKLCITNSGSKFEIKKFAGKLKETASLLTGIPIKKFEDQDFKMTALGPEWKKRFYDADSNPYYEEMTVRKFLQLLGTEAMRVGLHTNVWVNALFADYKWYVKSWDELGTEIDGAYPNWVITDMRFPNEMEAVVEKGGITIRVVRPGTVTGDHPSETALDDAAFDYEIINDGSMEELVSKVRSILVKEEIIRYIF